MDKYRTGKALMSGDLDDDVSVGAETEFVQTLGSQYSFYLTGHINSPDKYISWFNKIRNSTENDQIVFHINSYGGRIDTAVQLMHAINESPAHVITSVEGSCMSAATFIFLSGDSFTVNPLSSFMFHNYSGGSMGKGGEMYDHLIFERKWSENLLRTVYRNFLTEQEIAQLLANKDLWMDSEEIVKRCKALVNHRRREYKRAMKQSTDQEAVCRT